MLRPATFFVAVAALAAGPTIAKDKAPDRASAVGAAFGNTIVSTYDDGRTAELWLERDGSYTAEGRRHDPSRGHWSVKGERLCIRQARPIPILFSFCTPIPKAGMDQAWPAKAASGEAITVKVVNGRFDPGGRTQRSR